MPAAEITAWLAPRQSAMIAWPRDMVDSGSYNKPGIDAVGDVIRRFFASHGIPVETVARQRHSDCLRAPRRRDGPTGNAGGNIVSMGHRDAVFADGEAARRPFAVRDGIAHGPGVANMKAGLAMNGFVLAAFAKFGGAPAPLVDLFTGDEEIGSPEGGRAVIEAETRRAGSSSTANLDACPATLSPAAKAVCSWLSRSPARPLIPAPISPTGSARLGNPHEKSWQSTR